MSKTDPLIRPGERMVSRKVKVEDLSVGMVLYRMVNGRLKVRKVEGLWNGEHIRSELSAWGVYLGPYSTTDWLRVQYTERRKKDRPRRSRCTQKGLARWAHGVVEHEED